MTLPIIFLSYSHKDERQKKRLITQLKVLESAGCIDVWSDDRIAAGDMWEREINQAIAQAHVAILLITANYLTSNFITQQEVPEILKRHAVGAKLTIYPIIATDCAWQAISWLVELNVRPKNGTPVWRDGGRYVDRDLAAIATEIQRLLQNNAQIPAATVAEGTQPMAPEGVLRSSNPMTPPPEGLGAAMPERLMDPAGPVGRAIRDIGTLMDHSGGIMSISMAQVHHIIARAIDHGAPLYNAGGIQECAAIYLQTAQRLLALLEGSRRAPMMVMPEIGQEPTIVVRPMPMLQMEERFTASGQHIGLGIVYEALHRTISTMDPFSEQSANRLAWDLRYAFDYIIMLANHIQAVDAALNAIRTSSNSSHAILNAIRVTASVQALYEQGLQRQRDWIEGCAAVYLYASQGLMMALTASSPMRTGSEQRLRDIVQKYLKRTMAASVALTEGNAYKIAWELCHAYECILAQMSHH